MKDKTRIYTYDELADLCVNFPSSKISENGKMHISSFLNGAFQAVANIELHDDDAGLFLNNKQCMEVKDPDWWHEGYNAVMKIVRDET